MQRITFLIVFFITMSISAQEVQLSWQKDLITAQDLAKAEDKSILIYFIKSDCDSCQQFYDDFFKQEEFTPLSKSFVLTIVDGSPQDIKSNDLSINRQRRWTAHYNKESKFPAVLAVDNEGHKIGEILDTTTTEAIEAYWNFLKTIK